MLLKLIFSVLLLVLVAFVGVCLSIDLVLFVVE